MRRPKEGDLLETEEGLIFHVKGLQPSGKGAIAFLRYVPSDSGDREKEGKRYTKIYSIGEKFDYLEKNFPKYVRFSDRLQRKIQFVEKDEGKKVYRSSEKLRELMEKSSASEIEKKVVEFAEILIDSGVDQESLGITGSVLAGVQKENSDIDMIGYGEKEGKKIYSVLKNLKDTKPNLSYYSNEDSLRMARFRWEKTEIPTKIFSKIEKKKVLHGLFKNTDYFFRLVKNNKENIENRSFTKQGKRTMIGKIKKDDDAIFTPNHYTLEKNSTEVEKLTSYRGRFTEQAKEGDKIVAKGRLEEVNTKNGKFKRLLLGKPDEYLLPLNKDNTETVKKYASIDNF